MPEQKIKLNPIQKMPRLEREGLFQTAAFCGFRGEEKQQSFGSGNFLQRERPDGMMKIEGALPKRARYHCGLMDMNTLNMGADFEALPESYVIFITAGDPFGEHLPIYHIDRIIEETGNPFQDQSHIIYVNSDIRGDTALGRLMHDFHCQRADEMYSQVLAERVRELKETQEGVDHMCQEMEKIYREGRKEGREAGRLEGKRETAINLAEMGMPVDRIAQAVKVNIQLVREWLSGNTGIAR